MTRLRTGKSARSLLCAVALVSLSACQGASAPRAELTAEEAIVGMTTDLRFDPEVLHVPAGTTVTWENDDNARHDVLFEDGEWSGTMPPGTQWTRTFHQLGTHAYRCNLHEGMDATIIVE
jgi:plastocyanin